jgi:hypothetical protein
MVKKGGKSMFNQVWPDCEKEFGYNENTKFFADGSTIKLFG